MMQFSLQEHHEAYFAWTKYVTSVCKLLNCECKRLPLLVIFCYYLKLILFQTFSPISGCLIESLLMGKWTTLLNDWLSSTHMQLRSKNRVHMPWSPYYCLFAPHICMVLFFAHIPFVVNHTFKATPPESCNNSGVTNAHAVITCVWRRRCKTCESAGHANKKYLQCNPSHNQQTRHVWHAGKRQFFGFLWSGLRG